MLERNKRCRNLTEDVEPQRAGVCGPLDVSRGLHTHDLLTGRRNPWKGRCRSGDIQAKALHLPGQGWAPSVTEPSGRGTPSTSQPPGDRAHSLSPEASEGTPLSFLPSLLISFSGSVPLSGFFSLITSGSETSVCSLSSWTQPRPLLSGFQPFPNTRLGTSVRLCTHMHKHTHACMHTHTQSFQL